MIFIERISFRTLRNLLYAAYMAGQMTGLNGRSLDCHEGVRERQRLVQLLLREAQKESK